MENLVWNPVFNVIEEQIRSGNDIILIIVPFIKLDALKQLHWVQTSGAKLKIIVRWRIDDLISGASDLEIYPYLKEKGCQLYVQQLIHLKLYIFADNLAFNTSGNLTLRGLGYSDRSNIEVGNMVRLTSSDWINIYKLIQTSQQVDDSMYNRLRAHVDTHTVVQAIQAPLESAANRLLYSISDLPATESPNDLALFYFSDSHDHFSSDILRRAAHDIATFGIPNNLSQVEFEAVLGESFRRTPFVQEFVSFLKTNGSLRFGSVTAWIHNKCEDVPLPYRWEVKDSTRIFYNWLSQYCSPDVTWDVPGQRSQVIYWQKPITR